MMVELRSSETSVLTKASRRNIPEDGIRHSSQYAVRHLPACLSMEHIIHASYSATMNSERVYIKFNLYSCHSVSPPLAGRLDRPTIHRNTAGCLATQGLDWWGKGERQDARGSSLLSFWGAMPCSLASAADSVNRLQACTRTMPHIPQDRNLHCQRLYVLRIEVLKNGVFRDVMPCGSCSASFIRVTTIGEPGTTLAVTSNRRMLVHRFLSP
jgi:hypothetical protein